METLTAYASDGEKPKKRQYECPISSATEFEKLKLRRPKVSAVRDFPVGFEQSNAQSNSCKDDSNAEPYHTDHVEPNYDSYHSEEDNSSLCSLESEVETDDDFDSAKLGIKRAKVSAIHDFPVAFQQFGTQANGAAGDSDGDVVELLETDHAEPYHTDHVEPNYNSCHSDEDNSSLCSLESEVETDDGFDSSKLSIKRPKVSANRDFPVAFEQFGAQGNGTVNDSD